MARWYPYVLPLERRLQGWIDKFKTGEVPLVDEEIQKVLSESTFGISASSQAEITVSVLTPPAFNNKQIATSFIFSQQEGNCGGLWINRIYGDPQIITYMIKNIMSLLGDNVAITSNWQKRMAILKKHGWQEFLSVPGNRDGGNNKINFAYITLNHDELSTHRFSHQGLDTVRKNHPAVTDTQLTKEWVQ